MNGPTKSVSPASELSNHEKVGQSGIDLIAMERARQISVEGWTPEHDDAHGGNDIAWAAVCYAAPDEVRAARWADCAAGRDEFPDMKQRWLDPWPWSPKWDKRKTHSRVRRLVIAGALIAAEIDRLQRAAMPICATNSKDETSKGLSGGEL